MKKISITLAILLVVFVLPAILINVEVEKTEAFSTIDAASVISAQEWRVIQKRDASFLGLYKITAQNAKGDSSSFWVNEQTFITHPVGSAFTEATYYAPFFASYWSGVVETGLLAAIITLLCLIFRPLRR